MTGGQPALEPVGKTNWGKPGVCKLSTIAVLGIMASAYEPRPINRGRCPSANPCLLLRSANGALLAKGFVVSDAKALTDITGMEAFNCAWMWTNPATLPRLRGPLAADADGETSLGELASVKMSALRRLPARNREGAGRWTGPELQLRVTQVAAGAEAVDFRERLQACTKTWPAAASRRQTPPCWH